MHLDSKGWKYIASDGLYCSKSSDFCHAFSLSCFEKWVFEIHTNTHTNNWLLNLLGHPRGPCLPSPTRKKGEIQEMLGKNTLANILKYYPVTLSQMSAGSPHLFTLWKSSHPRFLQVLRWLMYVLLVASGSKQHFFCISAYGQPVAHTYCSFSWHIN